MTMRSNPPGTRGGRVPKILGKRERTIAGAALPDERLAAAAQLHHEFSFDEVDEGALGLDYEPRCSTSCEACRVIWVGSKAGEVLRMRLGSSSPEVHKPAFDSCVRALAHSHRLGQLLVGLDIGYVFILDEDDRTYGHERAWCHPARSLEGCRPDQLPYRIEYQAGPVGVADVNPETFMHGISAIMELPADDGDPDVDVAILTRAPELLVVRLDRGAMTVRARYALPGWGRCLTITGAPGDETLVCVTRSGELREWSCRALRTTPPDTRPSRKYHTNLLPNAVAAPTGAPRDDHALFVGANDGLYIRQDGNARPVHVPVTRSPVLSIATVAIPGYAAAAPKHYVALGLEDGRLRVIEEHALFAWLRGEDAPAAHDFRVGLGDAVLTLQILASHEPTSRFVLAGLRDHRLRLYHVPSRESLLDGLRALWRAAIGEPDAISKAQLEAQLATLLDKELELRSPAGAQYDQVLRYLLVDDVLPAWARLLQTSDERIVKRACEIAKGADDKVLYRLSATMGEIAGWDAHALIQLSQACLVAMPRRDAQRWRAFVSYHLKRLHACMKRRALAAEIPRLQHWSRFVRKYLLLGETFADKGVQLANLVECNRKTRKYLDALIYATQLEQQRYDLRWSKVACRDQDGRPQRIARVEIIDHVAIVITASAEIVFFDLEGKPLPIFAAGEVKPCLTTARDAAPSGAIVTRVARVTRKQGSWVRIALSWVVGLKSDPPRLTVFDVRFAEGRVEIDGQHPVAISLSPRADGAEIEVHGLFGLPGADAFLVGLDSSESPLALMTQRPSEAGAALWGLSELSPGTWATGGLPAVLSTPVRAVAALEVATSGCYLAAAGAADGSLRFAAFDLAGTLVAWDRGPILLVHPINDIALAERKDDGEYGYVCYVGTETGESLCLLVRVELDNKTIVTRQLWRDLHDSPVIAVRPTKREPRGQSLYDEEVVFIVTRDGHIAIHQATRSDLATDEVTDSRNYFFEGMRFDRIRLPGGMTSWASPRSRSGFLASYPDGELRYGRLHAPRQSESHARMRETTDELYRQVMQDQVFYGASANEKKKLEICAMVRIGGGALRSYVLRKQLEMISWDTLSEDALDIELAAQLGGLSAEVDEERDQIKLVVSTVSSRLLDLDPNQIFEHCRPGRAYDRIAAYPRVWRACKYLTKYMLDGRGQSQRGAIRVRMTIMHALFRANVLWHAALDEQSAGHLPAALREVLTACLRDEDRIVCVEALRAVAVMLRNISLLMRRADAEHRVRLRVSFFPRGLTTVQWLVSTLLENFTRYRRHGQPVLLSTPWSYVTVLVLLIRLFPGDALGICEQISHRGLSDSIEAILARLRGRTARPIGARMRELWTMPLLRQRAQARAEFIALFDECNVTQRLIGYEIGPDDTDYIRATGLLHVYRYLALLWKVNQLSDLNKIASRWSRGGDLPELTGSLAIMPRILNTFLDIARGRPEDRVAKLRTQISNVLRDSQRPPDAVRLVLDRVVEHWQAVLEPRVPTTDDEVLGRKLAASVAERSNSLVYAVADDPAHVVSVLRYPRDSKARVQFNSSARLGRELAARYPDSFVAVKELEPTSGRAVLGRFTLAKELLVELDTRDPDERPAIARLAATQLARALRCLHAEGLNHGDLCADNVFVTGEGAARRFRLGDLRTSQGDIPSSVAALRIPTLLHEAKGVGKPENWIDLVSLTLFLYEVLTGAPLPPRADGPSLATVAAALKVRDDAVAQAIADMLASSSYRTIEHFEQAIRSDQPAFEHRPLAGRVQAEHDVFISYDSADGTVARALDERLREHGVVPYFDQREDVPEQWWKHIQPGLDNSRSFAILVGDVYRPHGRQHEEVRYARSAVTRDRLPFHVFMMGATCPTLLKGSAPISVGRDVDLMVSHIIRSFEHPIRCARGDAAMAVGSGPLPAVYPAAPVSPNGSVTATRVGGDLAGEGHHDPHVESESRS